MNSEVRSRKCPETVLAFPLCCEVDMDLITYRISQEIGKIVLEMVGGERERKCFSQ